MYFVFVYMYIWRHMGGGPRRWGALCGRPVRPPSRPVLLPEWNRSQWRLKTGFTSSGSSRGGRAERRPAKQAVKSGLHFLMCTPVGAHYYLSALIVVRLCLVLPATIPLISPRYMASDLTMYLPNSPSCFFLTARGNGWVLLAATHSPIPSSSAIC